MDGAKHGDWVQIHRIVLEVGERAPKIPDDTLKVPFELRVKGFLVQENAVVGEEVTIHTMAGRLLTGTLVQKLPEYRHGFGSPQPELLSIIGELRKLLAGGGSIG